MLISNDELVAISRETLPKGNAMHHVWRIPVYRPLGPFKPLNSQLGAAAEFTFEVEWIKRGGRWILIDIKKV